MAKKKVFSIGSSLAEGLEETFAAAHHYSGELRIDVIPIKKIEVDPENPRDLALTFNDIYNGVHESDPDFERKMNELHSLEGIAHSIKEQGIINPILVYRHQDKYRLVAGERRTLASILANKTDIQAKIIDGKPTPLKISLLQWIENIERSDLSLAERLSNLTKIVQAFADKEGVAISEVTVTDLSHLIGCAKSHAVNLKAVLNADESLKELIRTNKIKNLEKAALIAGIESQELRHMVVNECVSGAPYKRLKTLAEQGLKKMPAPKKTESRGRQTTLVKLGVTKSPSVAKVILESILNNAALSHLAPHFKNVDFKNHRSVGDTFKNLIKKLEEIYE